MQVEEAFERPFVEKYRPETLEDVVGKHLTYLISPSIGNKFAIDQLKAIVKFGNMPNLILVVGPALLFTLLYRALQALGRLRA